MGISGVAVIGAIACLLVGVYKFILIIYYKVFGVTTSARISKHLDEKESLLYTNIKVEIAVKVKGKERFIPYIYRDRKNGELKYKLDSVINVIWLEKNKSAIQASAVSIEGLVYLLISAGLFGLFYIIALLVTA